jgi:hypothetical protein
MSDLLSLNPIFRDYNFEGNNITLLVEHVCYLGALTTYFLNKIAKNQYMDTADLYETVHTLARLRGYNAQGYISGRTTLSISVSGSDFDEGDVLYIPAWKQIASSIKDDDGNVINYSTVNNITTTIPVSATFPYDISQDVSIPVRQGDYLQLTYSGTDLIDNKINLPLYNFDYDDDLLDDISSIEVLVGDQLWTRVSDFYDMVDALENIDTVYMFRYDKYQRYVIEFALFRDVPKTTDTITINLLKSLGAKGGAGTGTITQPETQFIYNQTTGKWCDNTSPRIVVTNPTATVGQNDPETIDEIKNNSENALNQQKRCVTKADYKEYLEERADVVAALVWGEQEIAPSGSVYEYNKVHVSVIPSQWGSGTIETSSASAGVDVPYLFTNTYKNILASYLEPRKMLNAYEVFEVPELVYFNFRIGYTVKRTFDPTLVRLDILHKLEYYFNPFNRAFNELISHTNIVDFMLDTTIVSTTDAFSNVRGIQDLIIRNMSTFNVSTYSYNVMGNYPMYEHPASDYAPDINKLNNIQLGFNQFAQLYIDGVIILLET